MFFRFYNEPGRQLPLPKQTKLRSELMEIAQTGLHPIPDYQCLSSRADALDDKLIVVGYAGTEDNGDITQNRPVAFTSAIYLNIPGVDHPVLHTGLTVAVPSLQRTGIVMQLCAHLFLHVAPMHAGGMWVTTLAAVLSSLVQSEKVLYKTHPSPQNRPPLHAHLAIAHAINKQYRPSLLISPDATWDEEHFVFRGSMDWPAAECFKKDIDDVHFWHRDGGTNAYFHKLMRPGKGDEVLLVGFIDAESVWKAIEQLQRRKSRL
ncbi:hypothetical protein B0H16DRAFT_310073 [Mycena metata]|uniref:Uncharacterized protein n=1 Tax=Mycena metata TaxID=1033252 RepID=A0AAD7NMN1_9AGAR|nr:hypothetical protein B0H16DRAFT_310073 [Mycena metata]